MQMDGQTVLVTGSTGGVGRYVAANIARLPDPLNPKEEN
jgi:NAD(P)-dependent dehydrogenase (short-subunit alcohol dehydrogenase family)